MIRHGTGRIQSLTLNDATGNRISKTTSTTTTYYVRDASGNVMAVYEGTSTQMKVIETDLYGSNRLDLIGTQTVATTEQTVSGFGTVRTFTFTRGEKSYELSNHLGNVLSTISDRRQQMPNNSTVSYYIAEVTSATDYYPFGMQMSGRTVSSSSYRYGFNGKENDNDVKGDGNQIDFGARIYDTRIGRWLSLDILQKKYPDLSPYNYCSNNPLLFVDPDGKVIRVNYGSGTYDFTPGQQPATKDQNALKAYDAMMYMMHTDVGTKTVNQLVESKGILTVNVIHTTISDNGRNDLDKYDPKTLGQKNGKNETSIGEVTWDPESPVWVQDKMDVFGDQLVGELSATTALFHELTHGQDADDALNSDDPTAAIVRFKVSLDDVISQDDQYDNKGEKKSVLKENEYVRQANSWEQKNSKNPAYQPIRHNHKGAANVSKKERNPEYKSNPNHVDDYYRTEIKPKYPQKTSDDGIKNQ